MRCCFRAFLRWRSLAFGSRRSIFAACKCQGDSGDLPGAFFKLLPNSRLGQRGWKVERRCKRDAKPLREFDTLRRTLWTGYALRGVADSWHENLCPHLCLYEPCFSTLVRLNLLAADIKRAALAMLCSRRYIHYGETLHTPPPNPSSNTLLGDVFSKLPL